MKVLYAFLGILAVAIIVLFVFNSLSYTEGTIEGVVMLGPICPVMQDPPDPQCADKPYETELALLTSDQSRVVKKFKSDVVGRFAVSAPPGEYIIQSASVANVLPYCSSPTSIRVVENETVQADVSCDTGIR